MKPTINDFSESIYIERDSRDHRKQKILEKYFHDVSKNLCLNEAKILMEKNYYEVADSAAKIFYSFVTIDCDMKIGRVYDLLKHKWEEYGVNFPRQRFGKLLKNVYRKGLAADDTKMAVLSAVIDTAFRHPDIYKYTIARLQADGKTELVKTLHKMADRFNDIYGDDKVVRYFKPARLSEAEGRNIIYRKGEYKNLPNRGYDGGSYEWSEE